MRNIKNNKRGLVSSEKKAQSGFTIIEVLIVLAIAGLIMVIVFLAVPALQRNNRNTQRNSDASRISAAINECVTNNNGNLTNCAPTATGTGAQFANYINVADNQQLTSHSNTLGLNTFTYTTNTRCNSTGSGTTAGGGNRAFTIQYQVETRGAPADKCVGS